jgi:hypothetical protein
MSATSLDVFDKTLQTTNIWLDEIMVKLGLQPAGQKHHRRQAHDRHVGIEAAGVAAQVGTAGNSRLPVESALCVGRDSIA